MVRSIISAPNPEVEAGNLRPLKSKIPAEWSHISNAMRGLKYPSLHKQVLDEVLGLELFNFSRQLKMKPGNDDDHQVIVEMSNDLWFRRMEVEAVEKPKRQTNEKKVLLEAMVLRTKPRANKWLHLNPRIAALGMDAFDRGPPMIAKIHAYLVRKKNLAESEGEKSAEFLSGCAGQHSRHSGQRTSEEKKLLRGRRAVWKGWE